VRADADDLARRAVEVGVSGRCRGGRAVIEADGLERLGVEGDRQRGLGQREPPVLEADDVDRAVVRELTARGEGRRDAAERRAAWVRAELAEADASLGGRLGERARAQVAVAVRHAPVGEREAVQQREAVEPVVDRGAPDVELRRARADQRTAEPVGQRTLHVELDGLGPLGAGVAEAELGAR
jgi:hypothetical protein